jgi:dihydropteroate synthase
MNPFNLRSKPWWMGIINATPDSFSDGGKNSSADGVLAAIKEFHQHQFEVVDIGCESTAPSNHPLTALEEKKRLDEWVIPALAKTPFWENLIVSIDTYRFENFHYVYESIVKTGRRPKHWIFNDVSGSGWRKGKKFLGEADDVSYVYTPSLCPSPEEDFRHARYHFPCNGDDFLKALTNHMDASIKELAFLGSRLILDPGFGFSKTRAQCLFLAEHLPRLLDHWPSKPWLIGVSRKSFLRGEGCLRDEILSSEDKHLELLKRWSLQSTKFMLIFRVHDPLTLL